MRIFVMQKQTSLKEIKQDLILKKNDYETFKQKQAKRTRDEYL